MPVPSSSQSRRVRAGAWFGRFRRNEQGAIALEAIILAPLLLWCFVAMFSFFDMLRMQSMNQKATFTVADAYSRETNKIDDTFVTNSFSLMKSLVRHHNLQMRVSVLDYNADEDRYVVKWSKVRGASGQDPLSDTSATAMREKLPLISSGDEFILFETWNDYQLPFKIGMDDFEMRTRLFMNPRFTSQLKWDDGTPS
ncbi:TadE/TadG family type IV pilus assembly protein [Pseudooceanicola sp. C21-150M6]|uniref:TadE/TadG family type IV pilus assembly protein n=1 Tax=Pseudooceanicola sp. C21-150M6 TaxID=3434355 RepID=UPI003D7FDA28